MSESSKAVFLSYASQDAEAAKRICDALRAAGVEVWFDQSELRGGDAWDQKIRRQIKECALFVPIISASTQARHEGYFRLEWHLAEQRSHLIARGRPFIVPVAIDRFDDGEALVPDAFLAVQWTHVPDGALMPDFLAQVRRLLGAEAGRGFRASPTRVMTTMEPGLPLDDRATRQPVDPKSVAVLAFTNLSTDAENEFFSDGISEELINLLVRVPGLKVTARASAFHFKGLRTPVPEVARQLGVAFVVEGSVRKAAERVRITAQLIKAADGFHVWSDTFTRDLKDIFAVQDEIAGLIAQNLELKLDLTAMAPAGTVNPEAYRLYLLGRFAEQQANEEGRQNGVARYLEALDRDAGLAVAWAGLARIYSVMARIGFVPWAEGVAKTRAAADRALTLNPDLPEGLAIFAEVKILMDWNWPAAEATLRRAQALAPGNAHIKHLAGRLARIRGRLTESIVLYQQAVACDPLRPVMHFGLAGAYHCADRLREAEASAQRAISLGPEADYAHGYLARVLLAQQRVSEALVAALEEKGPLWRALALALVRHAEGKAVESDALVNEMIEKWQTEAAAQIAEACAYRGEIDRAFAWLDRAYLQSDPEMAHIKAEPLLRNLHGDARWLPFLRKMNLADDQLT